MSICTTDCELWIGSALVDEGDRRLGTIEEIYFDEPTGCPQWLVVRHGRFSKRSFVPLTDAKRIPDGIMTPYGQHTIGAAPRIATDEDLGEAQAQALYSHYDLAYDVLVDTDRPDAPSARERVLSYLM